MVDLLGSVTFHKKIDHVVGRAFAEESSRVDFLSSAIEMLGFWRDWFVALLDDVEKYVPTDSQGSFTDSIFPLLLIVRAAIKDYRGDLREKHLTMNGMPPLPSRLSPDPNLELYETLDKNLTELVLKLMPRLHEYAQMPIPTNPSILLRAVPVAEDSAGFIQQQLTIMKESVEEYRILHSLRVPMGDVRSLSCALSDAYNLVLSHSQWYREFFKNIDPENPKKREKTIFETRIKKLSTTRSEYLSKETVAARLRLHVQIMEMLRGAHVHVRRIHEFHPALTVDKLTDYLYVLDLGMTASEEHLWRQNISEMCPPDLSCRVSMINYLRERLMTLMWEQCAYMLWECHHLQNILKKFLRSCIDHKSQHELHISHERVSHQKQALSTINNVAIVFNQQSQIHRNRFEQSIQALRMRNMPYQQGLDDWEGFIISIMAFGCSFIGMRGMDRMKAKIKPYYPPSLAQS